MSSSWSSYCKIWNLGHGAVVDILNGDFIVEEKVDGCFHGDTRITMETGERIEIKDIAKNPGKVISYNEKTGDFEPQRILRVFKNPAKETEWVKLSTERKGQRGVNRKNLILTKNHRVLTSDGWKEAGDLVINRDRIFFENSIPDYVAGQFILGSLLGDGHLTSYKGSNSRFSYAHSKKQRDLVLLGKFLMKGIAVIENEQLSGFGSKMFRICSTGHPFLTELRKLTYPNDIKTISKEWLNRIDPVGLAFWYMDDGSIQDNGRQYPTAHFSTCSFSKNEQELMQEWLLVKYGINSNLIFSKNKYYTIKLDKEGSKKFFHLVAPYIIKQLRYKLPRELRQTGCFWENYEFPETKRVKNGLLLLEKSQPTHGLKVKYDLEIENTHTYIANDFIVHNSQFSFGIFNGEIKCRSKGQEVIVDAPDKLFQKAVDTVKEIAPLLKDGWTYRGEYLSKPKHNSLAYDRVPNKNIIVFDINPGQEQYLSLEEKHAEAARIGLECVPFFSGSVTSSDDIFKLLEHVSCLGGQKIEGVVIKAYKKFGPDGKALMAKHVSEQFKEVHKREWKVGNPKQGDIIALITEIYKTPSRWNKAVQHLREDGRLTDTPKDIGGLLIECTKDLKEECESEIKEQLFKWAWPQIARKCVFGLPQWWKEELVKKQFKD